MLTIKHCLLGHPPYRLQGTPNSENSNSHSSACYLVYMCAHNLVCLAAPIVLRENMNVEWKASYIKILMAHTGKKEITV